MFNLTGGNIKSSSWLSPIFFPVTMQPPWTLLNDHMYTYIHTYTYACMHRYIKYIIKVINTSQCTYTSHCHFQMLKQSLLWNTVSLSCYCPHIYNILQCIPFVCAILVHYLHLDVSSPAARTPFWLGVLRNRCLWECRTASCRLAVESCSAWTRTCTGPGGPGPAQRKHRTHDRWWLHRETKKINKY